MLDLSKWEVHVWERRDHPIEKDTAVNVIAHIRENSTGVVHAYRDYLLADPDDEDAPSVFMYEEGNYACDCNRHLFFHRSVGNEPSADRACGHDGYSVNLENPKTGEIFYREFD